MSIRDKLETLRPPWDLKGALDLRLPGFYLKAFEKFYLQIKEILDWQARQKQKKEDLPQGVEKISFSYDEEMPEIRQGNLYLPKERECKDLPFIIDIHGGGWIHGDKDIYNPYNAVLAKEGHIVSSLTYRTIDYANLIDQVQDIFAYWSYLKEHEQDFGYRLNHVMLTGDSAGAQLSLLCYCINKQESLQKVFGVKPVEIEFDCLALTHPVCFIDQAGKIPKSKWISKTFTIPGLQSMLYGKHFSSQKIYQVSVNPEKYANAEIDFPPILLLTSEGDFFFKYQTFLLADFFNKMNVNYEIFVEKSKNAMHAYNVNNPDHLLAQKANQKMLEFFKHSMEQKESE